MYVLIKNFSKENGLLVTVNLSLILNYISILKIQTLIFKSGLFK